MLRSAILAAVTILTGVIVSTRPAMADPPAGSAPSRAAGDGQEPPAGEEAGGVGEEKPVAVRFRLANGIRVKGELTAWDAEGIDGSFAARAWTEIHYEDIWRLHRRVMDDESADDWIDLARVLLLASLDQPKAAPWAERAFRRAARRFADDEDAAREAIDAARAFVAAEARRRKEAAEAAKAARLDVQSPEARAWGSRPWPVVSEEEQAAAVLTMRGDAERILAAAGLALAPVETDYFLFYSDMPRKQTARWARDLDLMYQRLAGHFDLEDGENIFWGKAVIFVFNQRDRFELVEAEAFAYRVPGGVHGLCHPMGAKVFVAFHRQRDHEAFAAILVHETVHGFMHRFRTPRRLPTWANEGIADYLASILFRNSPIDFTRRRIGLRYVRSGGDVGAILDMSYRDGTWPGHNSLGYSIGYLLVELMIRDRPAAFARWVRAIKDGKEWETALEEDFGADRRRLVDSFVRYYKVND